MAERLTKCLACDGRGYFRCECWPGDCICDEGDQNCFECGGDGFTDEGDEQGCYWPDETSDPPPPAEKMVAPPGYALVPIAPSKLMIDAGHRTYSQETLATEWIARAVWTAMVSTAKLEDQP